MNQIDEAIKVIEQGGIVIFPTDTAFGIGCRLDNENSLEKLFEIRRRPKDKAMPVLFDSIERISEFVLPYDNRVSDLMNKYWPGALTIILNCKADKVPSQVRGGGSTLGVRIPDHETVQAIIKGANVPITGSSANFAGEPTVYRFEDLDKSLIKLVDFIVEGKTNENNISSTVIDCSVNKWKILREGYVKLNLTG